LKAKFRLEFAPRFGRRLKDLDRQTQIRILREVHVLEENPHAGKLLRGQWKESINGGKAPILSEWE
jgi:mRNA-degrading endonuclease RelE of RelBE toxin-antitoxin system